LVLGLAVLMCACAGGSQVRTVAATPKIVVLQSQDVPVLKKCPQSDRWAGLMLEGQPEMLPTGMTSWSDLQAAGATDGWLSLYADNVAECPLLLGNASPKGRVVYAAAIKFKDSASAEADYLSDSKNFPVSSDFSARFAAAGGKLVSGSDSGLGDSSVLATISLRGVPTYVVFWRNKNFEAVVYAMNVSATEGSLAAAQMNSRIH
jgi:hypothetical protein